MDATHFNVDVDTLNADVVIHDWSHQAVQQIVNKWWLMMNKRSNQTAWTTTRILPEKVSCMSDCIRCKSIKIGDKYKYTVDDIYTQISYVRGDQRIKMKIEEQRKSRITRKDYTYTGCKAQIGKCKQIPRKILNKHVNQHWCSWHQKVAVDEHVSPTMTYLSDAIQMSLACYLGQLSSCHCLYIWLYHKTFFETYVVLILSQHFTKTQKLEGLWNEEKSTSSTHTIATHNSKDEIAHPWQQCTYWTTRSLHRSQISFPSTGNLCHELTNHGWWDWKDDKSSWIKNRADSSLSPDWLYISTKSIWRLSLMTGWLCTKDVNQKTNKKQIQSVWIELDASETTLVSQIWWILMKIQLMMSLKSNHSYSTDDPMIM